MRVYTTDTSLGDTKMCKMCEANITEYKTRANMGGATSNTQEDAPQGYNTGNSSTNNSPYENAASNNY